ncbi:hypothetical protein TNCV_4493011 [Trichonephila clavipes]|uniref:Uncharacterized protein n=1 Tax=Trichonephila clavipes TaxID=2585209 RepID=A0A8X6SY94_TRICX|nr:hypothetical protein TNCV_4493011 [Trichonephila clavipes]
MVPLMRITRGAPLSEPACPRDTLMSGHEEQRALREEAMQLGTENPADHAHANFSRDANCQPSPISTEGDLDSTGNQALHQTSQHLTHTVRRLKTLRHYLKSMIFESNTSRI